jgi:DNA-binding MarR family transcriptional regulator
MSDAQPSLDPVQLNAYFALIEVSSLLRHTVEQQLREAGDLSYVQFQLLATLGDAPDGSMRMTDLADGVVYSRSGLTYQAGLLEAAGLVTRAPSADDERGVTVTITDAGRARLGRVFPGHVAVLHRMLLDPLDRGTASAARRGRPDLLSGARQDSRRARSTSSSAQAARL